VERLFLQRYETRFSGPPGTSGARQVGILHAEASELLLESPRVDGQVERQEVMVILTPTPIATPTRSFLIQVPDTGELKALNEDREPDIVTWNPIFGRGEFLQRYTFEQVRVAGQPSLVRVPEPSIRLELHEDVRDDDPYRAAQRVRESVDLLLRLISFLSRQHVRWHTMRVTTRCRPESAVFEQRFEWRRSDGSIGPKSAFGRLVNPYRAPRDYLERMYAVFDGLTYRDAVSAAILYLVASTQERFLESELVNAFTALESLIDGIVAVSGRRKLLLGAKGDRFRRVMEAQIDTFCAQEGLDATTRDALVSKLPELNRPTITSKVEAIVAEVGIAWKDLWPTHESLSVGLQESYKIRNTFIHTGKLPPALRAHLESVRVRALCERLLYRLLGGEDDWREPDA
jgi:hypothetical protein